MVYYCNGSIFFGHWPLSELVAHFYFYLSRNGKQPKTTLTRQILQLEADFTRLSSVASVRISGLLTATQTELSHFSKTLYFKRLQTKAEIVRLPLRRRRPSHSKSLLTKAYIHISCYYVSSLRN